MCRMKKEDYVKLQKSAQKSVASVLNNFKNKKPDCVFTKNWLNSPSKCKRLRESFCTETIVPDVLRRFVLPNSSDSKYNRYIIQNAKKHGWIDVDIERMKDDTRNNLVGNGSIVFILESPHHYEYDYSLDDEAFPKPIAPAQNTTGNAILHFYETASKQLGKAFFDEHPLIIMNPVPWQTSLHFFHREALKSNHWTGQLRNAVWKKIWKSAEVKRWFIYRLNKYRPNEIINCCTGGENKNGLRTLVGEEIPKHYSVNFGYHPSVWGRDNYDSMNSILSILSKKYNSGK